ncbi:DUF1150 family protein [Brevundimonas sp.]|uniref:DUF1150 family protein n=1 Tax=Brevundimonas sp. TaxID=1871086 RepID=UPI0025D2C239|nr:DUF1150 family protein [Brevundimonas sp.]
MQTVLSRKAFAELGAPDLVYVREIKASELLADAPVLEAGGLEINPEQTLYAVHGADGARLAVLMEREEAFAAAVAHELAPVSVH